MCNVLTTISLKGYNDNMNCKILDCTGKGVSNGKTRTYPLGYCEKHYRQYRRTGNPITTKRKTGKDRKKDKLYGIYCGIKTRCLNENDHAYKHYGGRGITVCDRWLGIDGFDNFKNDVGARPSEKHSIDRINNDGIYEPTNVRWADASTQARNKRHLHAGQSGILGVFYNNTLNCYMASLKVHGKQYRRMAKSLEDAIEKRKELENKYLTA